MGFDRFFEQEEDVVFLETCKQLRKQHHMIIECVPLPKDTGDMAPIYFKVGPCNVDNSINQSERYFAKRGKTRVTRGKGLLLIGWKTSCLF